ncbi:MAG: FAD-binding oxidoreductase [Armatimonadetes bacterium]|nr:FAD-binding oxidoreductase [Armatimonadota bacterium]
MPENLIQNITNNHTDYLSDESRRFGTARSISFPKSEAEVIQVIKDIRSQGETITTQGARTGIVAGAVPFGGHILNLSQMNAIGEITPDEASGEHRITVEPGATLDEIRAKIAPTSLFFPPDPTETTATIGGMTACNASGAKTYFYGSTRNWITSLRAVLADGDTLTLKRGENFAQGRHFSLTTEQGQTIAGPLPSYEQPKVKTAAGYYVADNMDIIDLFIGMEGTLGVITEIELRLIPRPKSIQALTVFLPNEDSAIKLVRALRGEGSVAIEFFNSDALDLLRHIKTESSAFENIPALKDSFNTAIYTEFHGESDDDLEAAVMRVMEAATALGGSDEDTWYATTDREMEPLKAFRHAIPEAVNLIIAERKKTCPEITKLGTDMAVLDDQLETSLAMYDHGLQQSGLQSVIFGHIGNNHLHVNILPRSMEEYEQGKALYLSWAQLIVALGGSASAEHGIGKIKAPFLQLMYGDKGIAQMRALRKLFDPKTTLNPGNLF